MRTKEEYPLASTLIFFGQYQRALDFEIEIELRTWASARSALESGQIDGLLGMYYSEGRSLLVDFSNPHTILPWFYLCNKQTEAFSSLNDLRESRVSVQKGDLMDELVTSEEWVAKL